MIKKILILIVFCAFSQVFAQNQFQSFVSHVYSLPDSASKNAAVDSFMLYARSKGIPFIEKNSATFLYWGNVNEVLLAGDFTNWEPNAVLNKLSSTNLYFTTKTFELNARLDYQLIINGSWKLDPENPHKIGGGFGFNSEIAMPEYIQPWEIIYYPSIPHGTIVNQVIKSTNTNKTYDIRIYLPPGYDSTSAKTYPSVYFQDGAEYISLGFAAKILDNLIDSNKIEPLIGVFVVPTNRNEEYALSLRNQYRLFFVNELVPWIDQKYKTFQSADKRLVLGDSYGANISALISYNHPDIFGNCGLHSAAFQENNYEAYNLIINGVKKDINFNSIWGTYEPLYPRMRNFRDSLKLKGYEFDWLEVPEGHSWGQWRATLDRMLIYFFPAKTTDLKGALTPPSGFELYQNYPNPFNPTTNFGFRISNFGLVTLRVYDILGKEIVTLINKELSSGVYAVPFDSSKYHISSGVYFYKLTAAGSSPQVKKMVVLQ